jgi:hypothetical protein
MQAETAKQSWARANRLAELADVPPPVARNFISQMKKASEIDDARRFAFQDLMVALDGGKDARHKGIKDMVKGVKEHEAPPRASKGDPNRPPRAGAPSEGTNGAPQASGVDINLLRALKKLLTKGYTVDDLATGVKFIQELRS